MQIETWRLRYAEARVVLVLSGTSTRPWKAPEEANRYVEGHDAADALDVLAERNDVDPTLARMAFVLSVALRGAL